MTNFGLSLTKPYFSMISIPTIDDIGEAAASFLKAIGNRRVIAFHGQMGAGKTTLINEICRQLGVEEGVTASPTFAIVNEYESAAGEPVYHFDLYRIESPEEALDFGIEDYFYSGNLCLIEWPERIEELLPDNTLVANLTVAPDGSRSIEFSNL